ncbi:MAG: hypothetical protein ACC661_08755, partial [Verrucomicrobiales bacterium]
MTDIPPTNIPPADDQHLPVARRQPAVSAIRRAGPGPAPAQDATAGLTSAFVLWVFRQWWKVVVPASLL